VSGAELVLVVDASEVSEPRVSVPELDEAVEIDDDMMGRLDHHTGANVSIP